MADDKPWFVSCFFVPKLLSSAGLALEKTVANWRRRKGDWRVGRCVSCR